MRDKQRHDGAQNEIYVRQMNREDAAMRSSES